MQVGSRLDHGGTWFQAITAEVGYAKTRYAYFNGVRMTLTASEPMYLDSDNIVDGYYCLWTYEGSEYEAGTFYSKFHFGKFSVEYNEFEI